MANTNLNKPTKPQTMAQLMASYKSAFISPKKGDVLEGTITKLTSGEILVDIGAKAEAVVLEKDKMLLKNLLQSLKVGDKVNVFVLNPESDFGNTVVSLRRFIDDKLWNKLSQFKDKKEIMDVVVNEATKGGFLVSTTDGVAGFLPNSQTVFLESSQNLVGKTIKAVIIEQNRTQKKIIFSQKAAMGTEDFENAVKALKKGEKVTATISNIAPFGIFCSIKTADDKFVEGFVHISEITWDNLVTIPDTFNVGDKLEAIIKEFDTKSKRVNLSLKVLTLDPFEQQIKDFAVDQKLTANVLRVTSMGVLFDLGNGVEGIVKKEKVPPTVSYQEGQSVNLIVSEIDKRRRKVVLTPVLKEKPIGYR